MLPVLLVAIFCTFAATFTIVALIWMKQRRSKQVLNALRPESAIVEGPETDLLRSDTRDWTDRWQSLVPKLKLWDGLAKELRQAELEWSVSKFLLLTLIFGAAGAAPGLFLYAAVPGLFLLVGAAGASGPLLYVRRARKQRMRKIEEQFPEALDFLSRAMRAGHAFSVSLEMLSEEIPDPIGGEFKKLYHEQNLGAPMDVALHALADRCGLLDVQFFVSAVLLHKETGGNLTEILTRLSYTIRERLRLKGQIRAASAHGRVTGLVLTAMPIFLLLGFSVTSPTYLSGLVVDPVGRYLAAGAVAGQILGYLCIKQITDIQV